MSNIPTAEEFIKTERERVYEMHNDTLSGHIAEFMKGFVELHLKEFSKELFKDVAHGDDEHRKWLEDKIHSFTEEYLKKVE